ncbi:MAG: hypothetical protein RIS92_2089 [Verrucomicrobiota bacterium]
MRGGGQGGSRVGAYGSYGSYGAYGAYGAYGGCQFGMTSTATVAFPNRAKSS